MASTYSQRLRIELIGAGDQVGTWGATTNSNFGTIVDSAIAGYTAVSVTTANQALTALNGAADQSRMAIVSLTTTTTANFNVYAPPASKLYVIRNASAYTATVYNSTVLGNTTAAGTGVAIPAGKTMTVWSDGTNFATQNNHIIGTVTGDVTGNASTVTNGVYTVGAQTIAGVKSFTSQIDAQAGVLGNLTGNADTATSATTQAAGTNNTTIATTAFVQAALQALYPVGSIYINAASTTNPATLLGFGTWAEFGAGKVLVGQDTGDALFDTLQETGGSKDAIVVSHTHTGSTSSNGAHNHSVWGQDNSASATGAASNEVANVENPGTGTAYFSRLTSTASDHSHTVTVDSTGSSGANANVQPYIVVKMWRRTA